MEKGQKYRIYDFLDYRQYLVEWMKGQSPEGRGQRSKLAKFLGCDMAYVTRVFSDQAHFSLEQAHALQEYLGHTDDEADFFLLLILYARAGTQDLKKYYETKLKNEAKRKNILKNRLEYKKTLSEVDQTTFYSSWYYLAIHMLVSMKQFQTKEALIRYLKISPKKVSQALEFLVGEGLVSEKENRYSAGTSSIHLSNDSPLISKHHANWKLQALQSLEREKPEELHYSSVVTLNRNDIDQVRKHLVKAIEEVRKTVKDSSPEDALFCYSLDLFEV